MNAPSVPGDPTSCSRLGGELRRSAARLAERHSQLRALAADVAAAGDPTGRTPAAGGSGQTDSAATERPAPAEVAAAIEQVARVAEELDRAGALLQRFATDLTTAKEQVRQVLVAVGGAGLELRDGAVAEPWGPADGERAQRRRLAMPSLQRQLDRALKGAETSRVALRREAQLLVTQLAASSAQLRSIPDAVDQHQRSDSQRIRSGS